MSSNLQNFDELFVSAKGMLESGRFAEAVRTLEQCVELDSNSEDAWVTLAKARRLTGNISGAIQACQKALSINASNGQAFVVLGICAQSGFSFKDAVENFSRALDLLGPDPSLYYQLGQSQYRCFQFEKATQSLLKSIELNPKVSAAYLLLGVIHKVNGHPEEAEVSFQKAIDIAIQEGVRALDRLAWLFDQEGLLDWQQKCGEAILQIEPTSLPGTLVLARIEQERGNFKQAEAVYTQARVHQPDAAPLLYGIVRGRKIKPEDQEIIASLAQALTLPNRDLEQIKQIHYGLGKAYEDTQNFKASMAHYDEANACAWQQMGNRKMPPGFWNSMAVETTKAYTKELLTLAATTGNPSSKPILIVGMIRSGTTLCAQMLSSHPEIGTAGELQFLRSRQFPVASASDLEQSKSKFQAFADDYLQYLTSHSPATPFVIDKMPLNYSTLGTLHLALPNARIIHVRRNPFDTCFSMYATPFTPNINFGHDQDLIVEFYQSYLKFMDHWRTVLPKDRFLEINYEDLVHDRETELKRMLAFVGVEWSQDVLQHEKNSNFIQTPSQWQARQPVYTTSIGRYINFEPYLGGLKKLADIDPLSS